MHPEIKIVLKMKNLFTMAMMSLAIFCTSCKKDENNSIEGSWYPESFTVKNGTKREFSECEKKGTITISSGKITMVNYGTENGQCVESGTTNGTYTIDGNKITVTWEGEKPNTEEFSVSGNTLTIVGKEGTSVLKRK